MVGPYGVRLIRRVAIVVVVAAAAGCRGEHVATISDLAGVEMLKRRFNADAGKPRVVLLLSPT